MQSVFKLKERKTSEKPTIIVKSQQCPTLTESIAIYLRKETIKPVSSVKETSCLLQHKSNTIANARCYLHALFYHNSGVYFYLC